MENGKIPQSQRSMKIAVWKKFTDLKFDENKTKIIGGIFIEPVLLFSNHRNVRIKLVKPMETHIGILTENGTWTGLIGRVARKEVDIIYPLLFITYERFQDVGYGIPFFFVSLKFVVRGPEVRHSWTSIIKPFSPHMWACVITISLVGVVVMYYLLRMEAVVSESSRFWMLRNVCWFIFGSLVNQGTDLRPIRMTASRILIMIWSLSSFVIVASYGGNLVSFLSYPSQSFVPRTFSELSEAVSTGKYACSIWKDGAPHIFIKNAKEGLSRRFGEHLEKNPTYVLNDLEEIIQSVFLKKVAFIGPVGNLEKFTKRFGASNFLFSEDSLLTYSGSFVTSKDFLYREEFNSVLYSLYEGGILNQMQKMNAFYQGKGEVKPKTINALTVEMLLSPLLILATGYSVSFICFLLEIIIGRRKGI